MELRQGTDRLRLVASSWPNVGRGILGASDLGKSSCGAVRGGDRAAIPGAALRAGECARSWGSEWDSAYPEYPVLVLSTPQPDSPTPSPSPAQPRLLPIPGGPHPVPISPSESSTPPGTHLPLDPDSPPGSLASLPEAPHARWGRRDPPCRTFPGAAVTDPPPSPALQARRQRCFPRLVLAPSPPPQFPQPWYLASSFWILQGSQQPHFLRGVPWQPGGGLYDR